MFISHAGSLSFSGLEGMAGIAGLSRVRVDGFQGTPLGNFRLDTIACIFPHTIPGSSRRPEPVAKGTPGERGAADPPICRVFLEDFIMIDHLGCKPLILRLRTPRYLYQYFGAFSVSVEGRVCGISARIACTS